jgi:poly(hydroxyalkanoate) depolymerase family esterase
MNDKLQAAMQRATELTRSGRLNEASAAIQEALGMAQGAFTAQSHASTGTRRHTAADTLGDVIDIEARILTEPGEQPDPTEQPPPAGGRGAEPPAGSFTTGSHHCAAGSREYKLFRPHQAPPDGRRPALVVMLHGCTQNPDDFATGTRMNTLAEARGWWVLYPAQSRAANGSGCWNWFKPGDQRRGAGEPEILADMCASLVNRHGLDPARVFVAGLSAGGAMAVTLGATHPERYAAVGVHSGLPHGSAHDMVSALQAMRQGARAADLAQPLPTIVFHGDQDQTVHPCNGEAVAQQAQTGSPGAPGDNGLETEQARAPGGRRYTRSLHRDAQGRVDTEHWLIHGAGHAWSGGSPAGSYTDPQGPDASAQMLRFFDEATKPADKAS